MPLIATAGEEFERERPAIGLHNAVCAFVEDIGMHKNLDGKDQHKCVIIWQLEQKIANGDYAGKPFNVSRIYTVSISEKSNLGKDLKSWFGKPVNQEKAQNGYDLEKLVSHRSSIAIGEKHKGNDIYAEITTIAPPVQGNNLVVIPQDLPVWVWRMKQKGGLQVPAEKLQSAQPDTQDTGWDDTPAPQVNVPGSVPQQAAPPVINNTPGVAGIVTPTTTAVPPQQISQPVVGATGSIPPQQDQAAINMVQDQFAPMDDDLPF